MIAVIAMMLLPVSAPPGAPVSAPPGAQIIMGSQTAYFWVVPAIDSLALPDYGNNGYRQKVEKHNTMTLRIEVNVGNRQLGSKMRGRRVTLPKPLVELEGLLNERIDGPFADQVALLMSWLRTELTYRGEVRQAQDVVSVLKRGSADCVGMSNVAQLVLAAMDVKSRYVTGIAFKPDDKNRRVLEGEVLHRWIEIQYEDVGWVFSDPAGKVNFVDATYIVLGIQGLHQIPSVLEDAVGTRVELLKLSNRMGRVGTQNGLDPRLRVRPNRLFVQPK